MSAYSQRITRERRLSEARRVRFCRLGRAAFTAALAVPAVGLGAAALTVLTLGVSEAEAQRVSDTLLLARICVHEAGWDTPLDCAAIHQVLLAGAEREGMSYRSYAYAYAGRALRGETARSWVAHLREDGREPEGWPETVVVRRGDELRVERHAPWGAFRDRWMTTLDTARQVMAGELTAPCESPPHDWGGRVDRARARRLGLIRIDCGDTRNDFYQRPALVEVAPIP